PHLTDHAPAHGIVLALFRLRELRGWREAGTDVLPAGVTLDGDIDPAIGRGRAAPTAADESLQPVEHGARRPTRFPIRRSSRYRQPAPQTAPTLRRHPAGLA